MYKYSNMEFHRLCLRFSQARTLAPVLAENNEIRFFVATQTLKPQNQIHLVELSENSLALKQRVTIIIHIMLN